MHLGHRLQPVDGGKQILFVPPSLLRDPATVAISNIERLNFSRKLAYAFSKLSERQKELLANRSQSREQDRRLNIVENRALFTLARLCEVLNLPATKKVGPLPLYFEDYIVSRIVNFSEFFYGSPDTRLSDATRRGFALLYTQPRLE